MFQSIFAEMADEAWHISRAKQYIHIDLCRMLAFLKSGEGTMVLDCLCHAAVRKARVALAVFATRPADILLLDWCAVLHCQLGAEMCQVDPNRSTIGKSSPELSRDDVLFDPGCLRRMSRRITWTVLQWPLYVQASGNTKEWSPGCKILCCDARGEKRPQWANLTLKEGYKG